LVGLLAAVSGSGVAVGCSWAGVTLVGAVVTALAALAAGLDEAAGLAVGAVAGLQAAISAAHTTTINPLIRCMNLKLLSCWRGAGRRART
jgi:hypothetical protein